MTKTHSHLDRKPTGVSWESTRTYVNYKDFETGLSGGKHFHENPSFNLMVTAVVEERCNGSVYQLKPGSMVYHPAGSEHSDRFLHGGRSLCIGIKTEFCRELDIDGAIGKVSQMVRGQATDLARKLYAELLHLDSASSLAIEGLVLMMVAEADRACRKEGKKPHWLLKARARLDEEFVDPPTVVDLAGDVGVHPAHLATTFQRHFGVSVGEYVRQRRVVQARRDLRSFDATLGEIGHLLGFADQSHFSRTFKRHTGMSPREYRQTFANGPTSMQES